MAERPKRIELKVSPNPRYEEGKADSANIKPGHLIAMVEQGESDSGNVDGEKDWSRRYDVHSTAGGVAELMFALEDALQGRTIDDAYEENNVVFAAIFAPGDEIFAMLAVDENVVFDDPLTSNGDGNLKKATGGDKIVAFALEDMDLTGDGAEDTHIKVRLRPGI